MIRSTIRRGPIAWACACGVTLRPYQCQVAHAVKDAIINHRGITIVVILPRQSGKNELQAHLFSWLLFRYSRVGGCIVSVSPTFKPQTLNNMDRVAKSLKACIGSRDVWKSSKGYEYKLGQASLKFFSGDPSAKVVGATADLLLSVDEAQEISPLKFDKDFDPMTASTNAPRIIWGIPWNSSTLLERERRNALLAQQKDGIQRVFFFTADDVRRLLPAYGDHVDRVIAEHGRNHPRIRSQYFCETIDAQSGMFNPARLALIEAPGVATIGSAAEGTTTPPPSGEGPGVRSLVSAPAAPDSPPILCSSKWGDAEGRGAAFLLDVAGQDESNLNPLHPSGAGLGNPDRDSTALTIVEIDLSTLETLEHPTYHVVARHSWVGENHLSIFGKLKNLAETWRPQHIVIDATGVGEGLWGMLDRHFPSRVIPVKFTQQEKSEIGWKFLSIIETGRFRDHCHTDEVHLQYTHCIYEVLPGPGKTLRWGVPDGTRGPSGDLIHDDFVLADSLITELDRLEWCIHTTTDIVESGFDPLRDRDPFFEMNHGRF